MIREEHIQKLAEQELKNTDKFIVELTVKAGNRIMVFIDSDSEISVDDCVALSRSLEEKLNKDEEDFDLMVSSAGLDQPFRLIRQYKKYCGRAVKVELEEGEKFEALLESVDDEGITVKKLIRKHKSKPLQEGPEERLSFSDIKETKPAVQFRK